MSDLAGAFPRRRANARPLLRGILLAALALVAPAASASAQWVVAPDAFTNMFLVLGGFGFYSGYKNGQYNNVDGQRCTASVSMTSTVVQRGNTNVWDYTWTIVNGGSGDFARYVQFGPGRGPQFLNPAPLSGTHAAPCSYDANWPNGPTTETDTFVGGPPVIGFWGGRWNPETPSNDAQEVMATPEPVTLVLLGTGLLGIGAGRWQRRKKDQSTS